MTHKDIYEKFMIEYDKANITSSYPSLTKYEVATILDKAYLALIAEKFTGNNTRKASFEVDAKAIADIEPLITRDVLVLTTDDTVADNEYVYTLKSMLYFISGNITINSTDKYNVSLVSHAIADKYKATYNNLPWIQNPVCYIENSKLYVLIDALKYTKSNITGIKFTATYIKEPSKFTADYDKFTSDDSSTFELSDTMAEELINLAIIMSLETVESTRLDSKIKTSALES